MTSSRPPQDGRRRWRRRAGFAVAVIAAVVGLTLVALAWVGRSAAGGRWLVGTGSGMLPGQVEVGGVSGRLHDGLELRDVHWRSDTLDVRMRRLFIAAPLGGLPLGRLTVRQVEAEGVVVETSSPPEPRESEPTVLPDLRWPVRLRVSDATIDDLSWRSGSREVIRLRQLALAARVADGHLDLERFDVHGAVHGEAGTSVDGELHASGSLSTTGAWPLDLVVRYDAEVPSSGRWRGGGEIAGSLERLTLSQTLESPGRLDLEGSLDLLGTEPKVELEARIATLDPRVFVASLPIANIEGTLRTEGPIAAARLDADLGLVTADRTPWRLTVEAERADGGLSLHRLAARQASGPGRIDASGQVGPGPDPALAAQLSWQAIGAAIDGRRWQSATGEVRAAGSLDDLVVDGRLDLQVDGRPLGDIEIAAHRRGDDLVLDRAGGALLGGTISTRGVASLASPWHFEGHLDAADVDPGLAWSEWSGRLGANAEVRAEQADTGWRATVRNGRVRGALRDQPMQMAVEAEISPDGVHRLEADGRWGGATLRARGRADATFDLEASAQAEDLATLLPDAAGRFDLSARLTGSRSEPHLTANGQASTLRLGQRSLDQLTFDIDADLDPHGPVALTLLVRDLKADDLKVSRLEASASGTRARHRLDGQLALDRAETAVTLGLEGGLEPIALAQGPSWKGHLVASTAMTQELGRWQLEGPVPVVWGRDRLELDEACWQHEGPVTPEPEAASDGSAPGRICAMARHAANGEWQADGTVRAMPLTLARSFLPSGVALDGLAEGSGTLRGHGGVVDEAVATVKVGAASLDYPDDEGRTATAMLEGADLALRHDATGTEMTSALRLGPLGQADIELRIAGSEHEASAGAGLLSGRVRADLRDVTPVHAFLPGLEATAGSLTADLELAGTVAEPRVDGRLELADGRFSVPELGLRWRAVDLTAASNGGPRMEVRGTAASGEGTLTIGGWVEASQRRASIHLGGQDVTWLDRLDAAMVASPDLEIDLADARLEVRGTLEVSSMRWPTADPEAPSASLARPLAITVAGSAGPFATGEATPLAGTIDLEAPDLAFLPETVPDIERAGGRMSARLTLGGSVEQPTVRGQGEIREAWLELSSLGVTLRDVTLDATEAAGDRLQVQGRATSGDGDVALAGEVDLATGKARFTVSGRTATVLDRPDLKLVASPDLVVTVGERGIDTTGTVTLDRARIDLDRGQPQVATSPDVTVVRDSSTEDLASALDRTTDLRLRLGDDVAIQGAGLDVKATGTLRLVDVPGRPPRTTGEISTTSGTYTAYGQTLTLERGRANWLGGPISDAVLDVRATRKANDGVIAGVHLTGPIDALQTDVFTEPTTSPSDAIAYLILGRPLDRASQTETNGLTQALAAAGLKGGNRLAAPLAAKLRLDQIAIEGGEASYEDARLLLGKQLSSRLYVAYGVGLFRPLNALLVRYRLIKRWTLQARSGAQTEVDLLYEFERGFAEPLPEEGPPPPPD